MAEDATSISTEQNGANEESLAAKPATKPQPPGPEAEVNIELLLAKNRSEIMYELRKMKHDMPVTKTKEGTKKLLEKLALQQRTAEARHSRLEPGGSKKKRRVVAKPQAGAATSASVESTSVPVARGEESEERFRSEEILQEVRGLLEQHQVTGFLRNESEREHLEQVLAGVAERGNEQHQQRARRGTAHRRRVQVAANNGAVEPPSAERAPAQNLPTPQRHHHNHVHHHQRPVGGYRMPRRDQNQIVRQLRTSPALKRMDSEHRDAVVSEISNLVHRQLVTSTLSGDLRGILELHIQERADRTRSGQGVNSLMESLQRRNAYHRETSQGSRNRSSDPVAGGGGRESLSSHVELRSDVEEMKAQLRELKQMMRMSFDLQMDIQRAIRQEVAAAMVAACSLYSNNGPTATAGTIPTATATNVGYTPSVTPVGTLPVTASGQCVICLQKNIDTVIYRCGHMCVCIGCGLELKGQNLKCPVCRAPINDIIRAYSSC